MQPCVALARSARDGYRSLIGLNVFMNGSAGLDNLRESRRLLHRFADEAERAICRVYSVDLKHCLQDVRAYRRGYSKQRLSLRSRRHRIRKRSEEHTSELQSLMRISYAVFCLKKKMKNKKLNTI